jgi:phosphate transport system permease protein
MSKESLNKNEQFINTPEKDNKPKFFIDKDANKSNSRYMDIILNVITGVFSSTGILVLVALLIFIFSNGWSGLSWDLFASDYQSKIYNTTLTEDIDFGEYSDPIIEGAFFSSKWGIAFIDALDTEKNPIVVVTYVDSKSPFNNLKNAASIPGENEYVSIKKGQSIDTAILKNEETNRNMIVLAKNGAEEVAQKFDEGFLIMSMTTRSGGGGIRGSIITTIYTIVLTLIIALPLGIIAAIYLHEYAKDNKITRIIRIMIEMTTGIPSIIFGLVGALVFIPLMDTTIGSEGGSIASGALTLTIILLPVIIKTTEEALMVIPSSYRSASLALGASQTQTTFKIILPNALPGILTATILSVGRIIGESAALIYAVGTHISDDIAMNKKSTTLAVHIWSLMSGETPNFEVASAISILILLIVLTLSILAKVIGKKLMKFEVK